MFDYVRCDFPVPDGRFRPGTEFQTKSLYCTMERFTITARGRLILHVPAECPLRRPKKVDDRALASPVTPHTDVDMEFHGDIRMCDSLPGEGLVEFVVRFTHGILEWIRPYESLTDVHQSWFWSKD